MGRSVLGGSAGSGPTGAALVKLGHDLGDSAVVHRFVCDYLGLFESRLSILGRALERGDTETALVSILSLESSSAMVGADGVVTAVQGIRDALPQDREAAGGVLLDRLVDEVDEERRRLDRQGFSCPPAAAE